MKPDRADEEQQKQIDKKFRQNREQYARKYKSFFDWWINFFWFRYKYFIAISLIFILLTVWGVRIAILAEPADLYGFLVTSEGIPYDMFSEAFEVMEDALPDVNKDEKQVLNCDVIDFVRGGDEYMTVQWEVLAWRKFDYESILMITDTYFIDYLLKENECAMSLEEIGLADKYESEDGFLIEITEAPVIRRALDKYEFPEDYRLYVCFKALPPSMRKRNPDIYAPVEAAIDALLAAE